MKGKKGLSAIIMTVIMIALVLIAIGIVWAVVQNMIVDKTDDAENEGKCIEISLKIDSVSCANSTGGTDAPIDCDITISRNSGGDAFEGIRVVYTNTTSTNSTNIEGNVEELGTTSDSIQGLMYVPNKVTVAAYFDSVDGGEKLCQPVEKTI